MSHAPSEPSHEASQSSPSPCSPQQNQQQQQQEQQQQQQQQQQEGYSIGMDFGNSTSVVASASFRNPQSVSVEVNRLAHRATPSAVAFDGKTRVVGEEAEARLSSLPGSCLQSLASWLAVRSLAEAEAFFNRFPYCTKPQVEEGPDGIVLVVPTEDGDKKLPLTVALGHFLRTLVSFAEAGRRHAGGPAAAEGGGAQGGPRALAIALPCKDLSIAAEQLLLAAAATGLDRSLSLSVLSSCEALYNCWCARHLPGAFADLQQQQQQQQEQQQQQLYIGLVDVGFMETVVGIARLERDEEGAVNPTLLITKFDANLGVAEAVTLVADFVAAEVRQRHQQEVERHSKKAARLFAACARAVTHLSGLADSAVAIEGFLDDEADLHVAISRQQFQELCQPLKASLAAAIAAALRDSNLSADAIVAVDVVGGGSRIPWVAAAIDEAFGVSLQQQQQQQRTKLRRTLDGGSSVAMGAASFAAGLSFISPFDRRGVQENVDLEKVHRLQQLNAEVGAVELAELRRLEQRNQLEAYLLEMQSAARGPRGAPLQQQHVQQLLKETEHWLLDHDAATETECAEALQRVKETLERDCKEYFDAVEAERQKQETDLEASAAAAAATAKEDMGVKLPNSQCIKRAKKNKEEANELFKDGNVELAVQRYMKALQYLLKVFDVAPHDKEEIEALRLSLHLNLAQAYLRLTGTDAKAPHFEAFAKKARASCDSALELDPKCVKALYRRATANERLKEYTSGLADVKTALQIVPEDADFLKLKERLEARLRAEKEQQKKIYSRMFG